MTEDNSAEYRYADVKVMIIDDSKTIRRTAELILQKAGCRVITAVDSFESLALVVDHKPDIIFVDIMMPRLDDQRTRSASSTKTAVGCRQKQILAPRFCPTKLKSTSNNLLGRPCSAFFGVGFTENGCGFFEKGGL